jgi:hypothetical protein
MACEAVIAVFSLPNSLSQPHFKQKEITPIKLSGCQLA